MCGIAGSVGAADVAVVERMTASIAHRGPSGHGLWADPTGRAVLGHRRLSIIDLSNAAAQPMPDGSSRYVVAFNGEIYNYVEIRKELEHHGVRFRTHGDTEVLVEAWARWGAACLPKLRGMFAFAMWDTESRTLSLVRDRFGIKPLLYTERGGSLSFASEVRAFLAGGELAREADPQAILDYLSYGTVRQPRTILRGVRSLLPGHVLTWHDGAVRIDRWYDLEEATRARRAELSTISYRDAVTELRRLLEDAARHHLVADVEVGAFLSGGIDSTAVVALMTRASGRPVRSFAVGFEGPDSALSELKWARLAADRLGTRHTEVVLGPRDLADAADDVVSALDQPSLDGTNTWFVSRATARELRVSLSGLGGDELFGGYSHFQQIALSNALGGPGTQLARLALARGGSRLSERVRSHLGVVASTQRERFAALRRLAAAPELRTIVGPALAGMDATPALTMPPAGLDTTAEVSWYEVGTYLRDTLLRDADAMSMAHALEVRPVLLDHVVAEYAFALPGRFKQDLRRKKKIFVDAVRDLLPDEVIRRPKMGFELPLRQWLTTSLRTRAIGAFEGGTARALFSDGYRREALRVVRGENTGPREAWRVSAYQVLLRSLDHMGLGVGVDLREVG